MHFIALRTGLLKKMEYNTNYNIFATLLENSDSDTNNTVDTNDISVTNINENNLGVVFNKNKFDQEIYMKKIRIIQTYYGISENAAIYIYYRRKRSYPWRKKMILNIYIGMRNSKMH